MSKYIIETRQLTKRFDKRTAVDGLDIQIPSGSVVGFVGVNGAGKTTTMRMLMGHLHPTGGEVEVLGEDPRRHNEKQRQRVAYVSENMNLPGWLTPEGAVKLNRGFYPRWDAKLAQTLLDEFKLRKAGAYRNLSRGQKRKVCILPAVCQNADVMVMDEPALGLDVMARHDFLKRVLEIVCSGGRTVFISSHLLSDLERIVDRIVLIDRGRLVLAGNLEDLKAGVRQLHFAAEISRGDLERHFKVIRYDACAPAETKAVVVDFDDGRLRRICELKDCTEKVRVFGLSLEDIFVELVKNSEGES
jgi:ABC-2 type transport system ATP-binding protein